jgi:hypothetical protein
MRELPDPELQLARLSHLGAFVTGKFFIFSGRFAKVCTTF